ncbi:hypothetical protein [Halopiger thermotolerans]
MSVDETCEHPECPVVLPSFPDENGDYYCRRHYPEPNGGTFEHIPDEFAEYREQKVQEYDR